MQARLKVLHDKANVKQVKLLPVTMIGRSTECNLKIASSQVSRNHCRITVSGDSVFVEDLGSANGTLVDGQPLAPHQPTAIAPGSHIVVGPAEFQIDYVAPTSATVVLQRGIVPQDADQTTELIRNSPALAATVPVAAVAPMAAVVAAPAAEVPVAVPVAAVAMPAAIAAVAEAQLSPVEPVAPPVQDTNRDTTLLEPGFNFGEMEEVEGDNAGSPDDTVFMFQDKVPESVPFGEAAEPANKKAKLKSLFSIFGRKDKATEAAPEVASAPVPAATVPSVFLPTVEPTEETGAAEIVPTDGDQASETAAEDDGFGQFLSQF